MGWPAPLRGSPCIRLLVADMRAEWAELDRRIAMFDDEFAVDARRDEAARRLAAVPGIGPINATALVAAVGDASAFGRARDLAAKVVDKIKHLADNAGQLMLSTITG
jgi:transposase